VQNALTPTLSHAEETPGRGRNLCVGIGLLVKLAVKVT
jgi:hypothetical protein